MENKSHETGSVVEIEPATSNAQGKPADPAEAREPAHSRSGLIWTDPQGSKQLVRQLMDVVNSKEEYEELQRDLEELEALCPSCLNSLKGGAA